MVYPTDELRLVVTCRDVRPGDSVWNDIGEGWWRPLVRAVWSDGSDRVHIATVNGGLGTIGHLDSPVLVLRPAEMMPVELSPAAFVAPPAPDNGFVGAIAIDAPAAA